MVFQFIYLYTVILAPIVSKSWENQIKLDDFDNLVQCGKVDLGRNSGGSHFLWQTVALFGLLPLYHSFSVELFSLSACICLSVYQLSPPNLRKTNHLYPFSGKRIIILYLFVAACKLPKASSGLCLLLRGSLCHQLVYKV